MLQEEKVQLSLSHVDVDSQKTSGRVKPFYCNWWAGGQAVTSLSREGRYQLDQGGGAGSPETRPWRGR